MAILSRTKRALTHFAQDEDGFVFFEFVILLPAFIFILAAMFSLSIYIATLSDIQQLTSDLTRHSLTYVRQGLNAEEICQNLQANVQPVVLQQFVYLRPDDIHSVNCVLSDGGSVSEVSVSYDMRSLFLPDILARAGLPTALVTRHGVLAL